MACALEGPEAKICLNEVTFSEKYIVSWGVIVPPGGGGPPVADQHLSVKSLPLEARICGLFLRGAQAMSHYSCHFSTIPTQLAIACPHGLDSRHS